VINFITKRRVQGVHVDVKGGFADDYKTINSDLTVGKAWDSGSVYLVD
jgi:iron complex outermembrane receptor protein